MIGTYWTNFSHWWVLGLFAGTPWIQAHYSSFSPESTEYLSNIHIFFYKNWLKEKCWQQQINGSWIELFSYLETQQVVGLHYHFSMHPNFFHLINRTSIYLLKIETLQQGVKLFKVNNKYIRTMRMVSFWCLFVNYEHISHLVSVSIVNFEHVITGLGVKYNSCHFNSINNIFFLSSDFSIDTQLHNVSCPKHG